MMTSILILPSVQFTLKNHGKQRSGYKVKQEGIIDLFGPGSTISYNDMPGNLQLPTTLITSINNTIPEGLQSGTLDVSNLAKSGHVTNFLPLRWNLQYNRIQQRN